MEETYQPKFRHKAKYTRATGKQIRHMTDLVQNTTMSAEAIAAETGVHIRTSTKYIELLRDQVPEPVTPKPVTADAEEVILEFTVTKQGTIEEVSSFVKSKLAGVENIGVKRVKVSMQVEAL